MALFFGFNWCLDFHLGFSHSFYLIIVFYPNVQHQVSEVTDMGKAKIISEA